MSELDELLARATAIDLKAAEAGDDDLADLAGDLDELAADAQGLDTNEPDEAALDEWAGTDVDADNDPEDHEALEPEGVDFDEPEDEPTGVDFDEPEEKAAGWGACPSCGSSDRDEFTDDTARCSECGTILSPPVAKKHYDFDDDLGGEPAGPVVEAKALDLEDVDEFDLLRARRLELDL